MRIRHIIYESLLLPFKMIKLFILVFLIAVINEVISEVSYSFNLGEYTIIIMIINSFITLILFGLMLSITDKAVNESEINYFDFKENLIEGVREYLITLYYLIISVIVSALLLLPTGALIQLRNLYNLILKLDINHSFFALHQISHELPLTIMTTYAHHFTISVFISLLILIIFLSFAFISKIILIKTNNMIKAVDIRIIIRIIKNTGYLRYVKLILILTVIACIILNILFLLEYIMADIGISAIIESMMLFIGTYTFHNYFLEKH